MPDLVIVGGSDAGISAALRARELAPDWKIAVAVADRYPSFSICGIPYYLSREVTAADDLAHGKISDIQALGIELLLDQPGERIDPTNRLIGLRDAGNRRFVKLILCTGANSLRPPILGLELPGVFLLRWMTDTFAFDDYLTSRSPKSMAIVGGGYIGLEMAEATMHRGLDVTVTEMAPEVMTTIDPDLGVLVGAELRRLGVEVACRQAVSSIAQDGGALTLEGPEGFRRRADIVLAAAGAHPEARLARSIGASNGVRDAIKVDRRMRTGIENVYAAGDCAQTFRRISQSNTYLPFGTTAHKQGRNAGENAVGGDGEYEGSLGTQSVRVFGVVIARTGFHDRDARAATFGAAMADALRKFLLGAISLQGESAQTYLDAVGFIPPPDFIRALSEKQIGEIKAGGS